MRSFGNEFGKFCFNRFQIKNMSLESYETSYKQTAEDEKSCILYTDVAHSKDLLATLQCLRSREELCDVILLVGYSRITAHRAVLAGSSPYFRAMFAGTFLQYNCF